MPETDRRLLTVDDVSALLGVGKSTIYAHVKANAFPKPIRLGPARTGDGVDRRTSRWRRSDIDEFLAMKAAESSAQAPQPEASA